MRKLFALLFVAAAFTFAACEKKGETTSNADSVKTDSAAADVAMPADTAKVDTAATAAPMDTAASTHKK
jgi:hypothetical protein